jgi:hypothetical protein
MCGRKLAILSGLVNDGNALRRLYVVVGGQLAFSRQLEDFDEVTSWRLEREAARHAAILSRAQSRRCSRVPKQGMR